MDGMPHVSIVVGFTPYHLLMIEQLTGMLEGPLHIFHPDLLGNRRPDWLSNEHHLLGMNQSTFQTRNLGYLRTAGELRRLFRSGAAIDAYLPHPYHPLANAIFFADTCRQRHIYEDGLLNYYDADIGSAHPRNLIRQHIRAAALGLRYRAYSGHITGLDALPLQGGYFTRPEQVVRHHLIPQRFAISLRRTKAHTQPLMCDRKILFLDQPIEWEMPLQRARRNRMTAKALCDRIGLPVLYKPHHAQDARSSLSPEWIQLQQQDRGIPAESLVDRYPVACVVGFFSSALVNIALTYPELRCYAIGCEAMPITINRKSATLADVFRNAGVETVD